MKKNIEELVGQHALLFQGVGLLILSLVVALLINFSGGQLPTGIEIGRIAHQDIRADKDYEIFDEETTEHLKQEAMKSVLPVYDWDDAGFGREKIIGNRSELDPWKDRGLQIHLLRHPDAPKLILKDFSTILSVAEAQARWAKSNQRNEIRPTLIYNESETKKLQEDAVESVKPVVIKVQAGESIIRSGDHFEPWHLKVIEGIRKEKNRAFSRTRFVGTFFFIFIFLVTFFFVLNRAFPKLELRPRDLVFLGVLLVTLILVERISLFTFGAIRGLLPVDIPMNSFYGLIPIAFGTMMVRLVLPLPMAMLFAPVSAAMAGILAQGSLNYTLYYFVGCVLSIAFMSGVRTRGQLLRVGLELGALNAVVSLGLDMMNVTSLTGATNAEELFLRAILAFAGGVLSAVLVMIIMPVFESLFNYLTPVKLLEYGSLNHPLLREMIVRAPGTYHHSHMVGTLAEAASEAIGADSLFARVASYFHDIGKMKKATYFIENQSAAGAEDKHASLAPSMSALIISSHVKDGLEMAREAKLPQRITDIIPQHQGTKLITYFYNKAKEKEDPEMHVVEERDYRYPGPKPQTREAGIILLADTVEAATRALKDRSPARLEEVVRNMINKNFIDGQLDECELTLKDLHTIAKSFLRVLMGIYHQRIEYPPDEAEKAARDKAVSPIQEDTAEADKYSHSKPLREDSLKEAVPKEISKIPPKNVRRL